MAFLLVVGVIVLGILSTIFNGFALTKLWDWFVVTTFNLQSLTIPQAIGLSSLISFITYQHIDAQPKDEDAKKKLASAIALAIVKPIFIIVFGWIVYQFIV